MCLWLRFRGSAHRLAPLVVYTRDQTEPSRITTPGRPHSRRTGCGTLSMRRYSIWHPSHATPTLHRLCANRWPSESVYLPTPALHLVGVVAEYRYRAAAKNLVRDSRLRSVAASRLCSPLLTRD